MPRLRRGRANRDHQPRMVDLGPPGPDVPAKEETLMRALRTSMAAAWLLGIAQAAIAAAGPSPEDLLKFRPTQTGVEYETPDRRGGDRRLQGRDGGQRPGAEHRLCPPRRPGQAAAAVRRLQRQRRHGPVELLPGRLRGLSRDRPERRQEPGRVPLAERRRHPDRDRHARQDHGLEADLGRGGLQGPGPGDRELRPPPARDGAGHARGARGAGRAEGGDRAGRRRRRRSARSWSGRW